jgi:hypothetical protein
MRAIPTLFIQKKICFLLFFMIMIFSCNALDISDFIISYKNHSVPIDSRINEVFSQKKYDLNIFIYTKTFESFENNYDLLIDLLLKMNINTVYLAFNNKNFVSSGIYSKNLRYFISCAHKKGLCVSALIYNSIDPYFNKYYRDSVILNLKEYLNGSEKIEQFDSITSDLEPNTVKNNVNGIPLSFKFRWNKRDGWGKDGVNNKLILLTFDLLKELQQNFSGMPISQTTQYYFNSYVSKGLLDVGSCTDFLKYCDSVVIMCYFDDSKKIATYCRKSIKETVTSKSVFVAVKTLDKGNPKSSLAGNNFKELKNNLQYIAKKLSKFSSFGGISVYSMKGILQIVHRGVQ